MDIKRILVHIGGDDDRATRLAVARDLAARFGAAITALYVADPVLSPAASTGRAASAAYLAEATAASRERIARLESEIGAWAATAGVPVAWRHAQGEVLRTLIAYSYLQDLAIVSASDKRSFEDTLRPARPEHLAIGAGCPVLVLPRGFAARPVGLRPMVAWKAERPAAMALRAAVPLLAKAESVAVVTVDMPGGAEAQVASYLAAHGIAAEPVPLEAMRERVVRPIEDVLLGYAHTSGRDLIVMGGFARSRVWEVVLGSTTRAMLERADVPLLMSH